MEAKLQQVIRNNRAEVLYVLIGCLVVGDVLTTLTAKAVMGDAFGEVGLVANLMMGAFHEQWPICMFFSEFAIFGVTTFFFAKSKNTLKMIRWRIPIAYLPALTILTLVANNSAIIVLFLTIL
jgi:hypothetical protein